MPPSSSRRKPLEEQLRRRVQVLLTDADYLRLLQASGVKDLSAFCRDAILARVSDLEASNQNVIRTTLLIKTRPADPDDHVMTLREFEQAIDSGAITDYDGFGEWAYAPDGEIRVSDLTAPISIPLDPPPWATHVAWYNK